MNKRRQTAARLAARAKHRAWWAWAVWGRYSENSGELLMVLRLESGLVRLTLWKDPSGFSICTILWGVDAPDEQCGVGSEPVGGRQAASPCRDSDKR